MIYALIKCNPLITKISPIIWLEAFGGSASNATMLPIIILAMVPKNGIGFNNPHKTPSTIAYGMPRIDKRIDATVPIHKAANICQPT